VLSNGTHTAESALLMLRSSFAGLRVRRGMKDGVSSIVEWTGLIPELKECRPQIRCVAP
jgi:hypothetical protein